MSHGALITLTSDELAQTLGKEDADRFCQWYGVTASGNFEGKSIPNLLGIANFDRESEEIADLRERVYAYRLGRTALHRDDKVLTAWNGLALAALAPFVKDYPIPERGARYYLCQNGTCAQPVDTVSARKALFA